MVKKYKTKPCEIEAIRWSGSNFNDIEKFTGDKSKLELVTSGEFVLVIKTLEGCMIADVGDFIIKGLKGEFYPCKPDIFHKKYEERKEEI